MKERKMSDDDNILNVSFGETKISPNEVLDMAKDKLKSVIIIGVTDEDSDLGESIYLSSSENNAANAIFTIEHAKMLIMQLSSQ
jgi:hypothetical protein